MAGWGGVWDKPSFSSLRGGEGERPWGHGAKGEKGDVQKERNYDNYREKEKNCLKKKKIHVSSLLA